MNAFECTFEQFKQRAKNFRDHVKGLDVNELENSYKAMALSYLHLTEDHWLHSAAIVLKMCTVMYIDRERELK